MANRPREHNQIRGITWDHPRAYRCLEASSRAFEAEHGVSVAWDRRSLQAFADVPIQSLVEEYDLVVLDHPHVAQIARSRCLRSLPFPSDADISSLGGSLESYVWDDALWAYPIDAACQMAVRRPDLCAGIPPTWEEILSGTASKIKPIVPLLPVDAFDTFLSLVASLGEVRLPHSDKEFVSSTNGLRALKTLKALYKMGPAEATRWNPIRALEALATTDEFRFSPCLFGYINYARPRFRDKTLAYSQLPRFDGAGPSRGILGGAGLGVSATMSRPDLGIAFAQWVASEPIQSGVYLENDGQPAHRRTWRTKGAETNYSGFLSGAFPAMETAWTRPRDVWFLGLVDDVCAVIDNFFHKDRNEEEFLRDMNKMYRGRLAEGSE